MKGPGRAMIAVMALGCALVAGGWWLHARSLQNSASALAAPRLWPALPKVVAIEVLNASAVVGLARVGTVELRGAGLDVKFFGTAEAAQRARPVTRVLIRAHDTTGIGRVLDVLGSVPVEDAPDPNRLVDFTVLLGDDYQAIRRRP